MAPVYRKDDRMKYLMFVATDLEPDREPEAPHEIEDWLTDVEGRGKRIMGDRLRPTREAKTIRVRGGKVLVTDGPFTDTKEVIVGFDILECETMEEAIEIASRHPMARAGRLELRAFWS
jgi:hypothetical protein